MSPSVSAHGPDPGPSSRPLPPSPPRALSFDRAAARYAAARPGYPSALVGAGEELAGRPLRGARTVDVGAGTGIWPTSTPRVPTP